VLHVHRAERADGLVDALRALLADPLPDPFAPEVVSVPTRGMERWLAQRMSDRLGAGPGRADGICANVEFPPPRALAGDVIAAASGVAPDADPWRPERMVWPLLEVVDASLGEPWARRLAAHLGAADAGDDDARRARRFGAVRHVADLLDRYAVMRDPRWRAGRPPAVLLARGDAEVLGANWARITERWPEHTVELDVLRLRMQLREAFNHREESQ
jgi:exodeoxyribonuclease V gamma subunit